MGGAGRDRRPRLRSAVARARPGRPHHRARATSTSRPRSGWCAAIVGIDAEAGPTEILVIADAAGRRPTGRRRPGQPGRARRARRRGAGHRFARARRCGASPSSSDSSRSTPHADRVREALDGRQSAIVLVDDIAAAAAFSNAYGPEHLELQTADPGATLDLIENAGAIFLGADAPVSLGRLPRRLEPRAADRRAVAVRVRARARRRSCGRSRSIRYDRAGLAAVRAGIRALERRRAAARPRRRGRRPVPGRAVRRRRPPVTLVTPCSARSAATPTVASSTRARATTASRSAAAGSAPSAAAASAPPRPRA